MDFGAFGAWWESQAWGTVADWFVAVGTVAAFGLAVGILFRDRKLRLRFAADRFVTFTNSSATATGPRMHNYKLRVFGHNVGDAPLPVAFVRVISSGTQLIQASLENTAGVFEIAPRTQVDVEITFGDTDPASCLCIVAFQDGQGQWWYRNVLSNAYIPRRRYDKLMRTLRTQ